MSNDNNGLRPQTGLVRAGLSRSQFRETSEALYLNSGFVFESAAQAEAAFKGENDSYIYSRYGNPTVTVFEERLATLEGADMCRATATGMAAVFASLACHLRAGQRVVASRALFGSCHFIVDQILPRWEIETQFVDGTNLEEWEAALAKPAHAVFLESPSNPMLDLVDIAAVAGMAHAAGARMIVDNVFATPLYQKPLELGADVVVYSATKHIDGHGRCLGGAVLADTAFMEEHFIPFYRHTGPSMSPFNAWVMAKSLETLSLRVAHQSQASRQIAEHLEAHPKVPLVRHPGLDSFPQRELAKRQMTGDGTLVTIEVAGGKAGAFHVLDNLQLVDISNNLGDAKTLACHPATTTHSRLQPEERAQLGISDGVIRFSIGLEDPLDLIEDLDRALAGI